jgi:hypothetical protein
VWRLVAVAELDVVVRDDRFAVRVEVFAYVPPSSSEVPTSPSVGAGARHRVRYSRLDSFRIPATHPLDVWGAPASPPLDELIWVAWPTLDDAAHLVDAATPEDALRWAHDDVHRRVEAARARA